MTAAMFSDSFWSVRFRSSRLGSKLIFAQIKTIIKYLPSSRSISSSIWIETMASTRWCQSWAADSDWYAGGALSGQIESKIGGQRNDIPDKTSKRCSTKMNVPVSSIWRYKSGSLAISLITYNYFLSPPTTLLLYQNNLKEKLFRSLALNATDPVLVNHDGLEHFIDEKILVCGGDTCDHHMIFDRNKRGP